jgi:hypothetical protein
MWLCVCICFWISFSKHPIIRRYVAWDTESIVQLAFIEVLAVKFAPPLQCDVWNLLSALRNAVCWWYCRVAVNLKFPYSEEMWCWNEMNQKKKGKWHSILISAKDSILTSESAFPLREVLLLLPAHNIHLQNGNYSVCWNVGRTSINWVVQNWNPILYEIPRLNSQV